MTITIHGDPLVLTMVCAAVLLAFFILPRRRR